MAKILVTGSSGFVGSHLIEELLWNTDHEIHAGVRPTSSKKYLQDDRIIFQHIDLKDLDRSAEILERESYDIVYHNAGLTSGLNLEQLMQVNAESTRKFYSILARLSKPPSKFIFTSSVAAYGPADFQMEGIVRATSQPHPVTHYGKSKLKAEEYIQSDGRIPWVIVRPTAVYGPRDTEMLKVFKMVGKGLNVQLGKEEREYTFVYVKDLVRLMRLCGESPFSNTSYFAASERTYSSEELATFAARKLGRKTLKIKLPMSLARLAAHGAEWMMKWTKKPNVFNLDKMNELDKISWKMDVQPQKEDLDYEDRFTLEQGVAETIDWYQSVGWI